MYSPEAFQITQHRHNYNPGMSLKGRNTIEGTHHQKVAQEGDNEQGRVKHDVDCKTLCVQEVLPRPTGVVAVVDVDDLYRACLDNAEYRLDDQQERDVAE